jgi:hypothetical protein
MREATKPLRSKIIIERSLWRSARARRRLGCAMRPASPDYGADQGKPTEAHDLLALVYGSFTEGIDTPVRRDTKALLDRLA